MKYLTELPQMSNEEIEVMNGFWDWLKEQPKTSPYKPTVFVKVNKTASISTLRDMGHKYFDMIWGKLALRQRNELYQDLADYMNIDKCDAHFKFFNAQKCIEAIEFSIQRLNDNRREDLDIIGIEPYAYFELIIK